MSRMSRNVALFGGVTSATFGTFGSDFLCQSRATPGKRASRRIREFSRSHGAGGGLGNVPFCSKSGTFWDMWDICAGEAGGVTGVTSRLSVCPPRFGSSVSQAGAGSK
jgi:hypothetical protein